MMITVTSTIFCIGFLALFLRLLWTDIRSKDLYVSELLALIGLGLVFSAVKHQFLEGLLSLCIAYGAYSLIARLTEVYYGEEVIGEGDCLVLGGVACFWGWQLALMTVYYAFLIGGSLSLILLLLKKVSGKTRIPFVPFLFLAWIMALVLDRV